MRAHLRSDAVLQFEKEMQDSFSSIPAHDFIGQVRHALAGEYFGAATYWVFHQKAEDAAERRFWATARDVEIGMIARLEGVLDRRGLGRPDRKLFWELGERAAAVFSTEGYRAWVAPLIDDALATFRSIDAGQEPAEDRAVIAELVAHEVAFTAAWNALPEGFEAATTPFAAHLRETTQPR